MSVKIIVTYDPRTDGCQVQGPIHNKGLCYGALEKAKDAIRAYEPSKIRPASTDEASRFNGNGGVN